MLYYKTSEIKNEAINKSIIRARGLSLPDHLIIDIDPDPYLKKTSDQVYQKLQSMTTEYLYDDEKIAYRIDLPENFNKETLKALYTHCRNYLISGTLREWYEENGYTEGAISIDREQEKTMQQIQSIRIARKGGVKTKYHTL